MGRSIPALEAEAEARKLGFGYLLRYEHLIGPNEEIEEVRCVFLELPRGPSRFPAFPPSSTPAAPLAENRLRMSNAWQAEVWADIHEFEHSRHMVRLFEHKVGDGLKEIADWRSAA